MHIAYVPSALQNESLSESSTLSPPERLSRFWTIFGDFAAGSSSGMVTSFCKMCFPSKFSMENIVSILVGEGGKGSEKNYYSELVSRTPRQTVTGCHYSVNRYKACISMTPNSILRYLFALDQ